MASTEAMIAAVVGRLEPLASLAQVEAMPDQPSRERFKHPHCAIWVAYENSDYDKPLVLDHPVQHREVRFAIAVLTRNLQKSKGAGAYVDAVRVLLHGWDLPSVGRMRMVRDGFADHEGGVWRHDVVVAVTDVVVPAEPVTPEHPLLTRITLESVYETQVIPPEEPEPEEEP